MPTEERDPRVDPPYAADERATLAGWLDHQRATLLVKCTGLDDAQRKRRPVPSSLLSLHGLVRHLTDVERNWYARAFAPDHDLPAVHLTPAAPQGDWGPLDDADWTHDLAAWHAECERSRAVSAAHELDDLGTARRDGQDRAFSLRWIHAHLIEEYARHNGHADLIRELIDGRTGA